MRSGLTSSEVASRRVEYGENRLPQREPVTWFSILATQFTSPLVFIIFVAAAISLALGERGDFVIIITVVVIDVALGFVQEFKAHQTYLALRTLLKLREVVVDAGPFTVWVNEAELGAYPVAPV